LTQNVKDYKSKHKLNRLLYNTKIKILNIESYDLHRQLHIVKRNMDMDIGQRLV